MKNVLKWIAICLCASTVAWCGSVISDRLVLNEDLIRLHVLANSDSQEDQRLKLLVRDAVVSSLQTAMTEIDDVQQAKAYLIDNLQAIEAEANRTLHNAGSSDTAAVTFSEAIFDTRYYDTFTLPAGVYESLRITIGNGEGKNWWCVVFPTLCIPATSEGFDDVAAGAGFPNALRAALEGETGYELRFYLLDVLGRMENILFKG